MWRQDLVILSPEGPRDSTCQLSTSVCPGDFESLQLHMTSLPKHDPNSQTNLLLGPKSCRTKVPRIFRIFVPNFAANFAPDFPRIFRGVFVLRFVGNGDQKKFTKNPCLFQYKIPRQTRKIYSQNVSGEQAK